MNRLLICLFVSVASISSARGDSAGMILLAYDEADKDYKVLIAASKDTDSRYRETLCGTKKEGESDLNAAAREVYEEARHKYDKAFLLMKLVKAHEKKWHVKMDGTTLFVAVVHLIDAKKLEAASTDCEGCNERKSFAWVPEKTLRKIVSDPKGKHLIPDEYLAGNKLRPAYQRFSAKMYVEAVPFIEAAIRDDIKSRKKR